MIPDAYVGDEDTRVAFDQEVFLVVDGYFVPFFATSIRLEESCLTGQGLV